jgi:hypothetical protein
LLKNSPSESATISSRLTTCGEHALAYVGRLEANLSRFSFSAMSQFKRRERYLGCTQRIAAVNDKIGIEPTS